MYSFLNNYDNKTTIYLIYSIDLIRPNWQTTIYLWQMVVTSTNHVSDNKDNQSITLRLNYFQIGLFKID